MVEFEKTVIIFWDNPLESQFFCNTPELDESFLTPCIEVTCPNHWSSMISDGLENMLNLSDEWFSEIEVHRMGIDDEELFFLSGNIDEAHASCFWCPKDGFTVDGREYSEYFLTIARTSEDSGFCIFSERKTPKKVPLKMANIFPNLIPFL